MKSETYSCDICGKQKGDVNHWWVGTVDAGYEVRPWHLANPMYEHAKHLCGQSCVTQALSQWMQGQGSLSALPVGQETK